MKHTKQGNIHEQIAEARLVLANARAQCEAVITKVAAEQQELAKLTSLHAQEDKLSVQAGAAQTETIETLQAAYANEAAAVSRVMEGLQPDAAQ